MVGVRRELGTERGQRRGKSEQRAGEEETGKVIQVEEREGRGEKWVGERKKKKRREEC